MSTAACPVCGEPTAMRARDGAAIVCHGCKQYRSNHRHLSQAERQQAVRDAYRLYLRALDMRGVTPLQACPVQETVREETR